MVPRVDEPPPHGDVRILPHDLDAERSVLGAILLHEDALTVVAAALQPSDFFRNAHTLIFAVMLALAEAHAAVDFITVKNALAIDGDLEEVGGPAYIASLSDGVPRSSNVEHYAEIVKEKSRLRAAIKTATAIVANAYEETEDATRMIGAAAEDLFALSGSAATHDVVHIGALVTAGMEAIEIASRSGGRPTGLTTGFPDLDGMTAGLQPSDLIIVAARTSHGKTSLALTIARHVAPEDVVLMFSLEMSRNQLFMRTLSAEARIDGNHLRTGYNFDNGTWRRMADATCRINEMRLFIDDTPSIGVFEARAKARAIRAVHGLKLIIVDYLQLMSSRGENRTQAVSAISRGLKALAKEMNVPVIALSQLKRAGSGNENREPALSDLRESGDIENDADVVLMLWRSEEDDTAEDANVVRLFVRKQRNGPTGETKLVFLKEYTTFVSLARGVA